MNTTIPASRDLPPGRRTEIRAALQRTANRRRFRFAPLLTAVTALGVIGLVAYFVPWQPQAAPPAEPTITTSSTPVPVEPVIAGLSPQEQALIAQRCMESAGVKGTPKLYNYVTTEDTKQGLVLTEDTALNCTVDGPMYDYNAGLHGPLKLGWLARPFELDLNGGSSGGDVSYANPVRKGKRGSQMAAGRITPEVARVTMTADGTTVDAVLANGTYLVRILHPSTWQIPNESPMPVVRAYDAKGALLWASDTPDDRCYKTPDGEVITYHRDPPDPATCLPAKRWR